MQYITVPLLGEYKDKTNTVVVAKDTNDVITQYASKGWTLVGIYTRNIAVKAGCLTKLMKGSKATTGYHEIDVAVFVQ